jgi:hypothetical protein
VCVYVCVCVGGVKEGDLLVFPQVTQKELKAVANACQKRTAPVSQAGSRNLALSSPQYISYYYYQLPCYYYYYYF